MQHISKCFDWFLDGVEDFFLDSDHPNASLILDQVINIRDTGGSKEHFELLADLMADDK